MGSHRRNSGESPTLGVFGGRSGCEGVMVKWFDHLTGDAEVMGSSLDMTLVSIGFM